MINNNYIAKTIFDNFLTKFLLKEVGLNEILLYSFIRKSVKSNPIGLILIFATFLAIYII
ncbi:hypothetical protein [Borreliella tanukii]|uniref:hypothetical protein n=1 Tax=Borreliella tanukii TaxID=56146 RepID=UPI003CC91E99